MKWCKLFEIGEDQVAGQISTFTPPKKDVTLYVFVVTTIWRDENGVIQSCSGTTKPMQDEKDVLKTFKEFNAEAAAIFLRNAKGLRKMQGSKIIIPKGIGIIKPSEKFTA